MVILTMTRHGKRCEFNHATVESAARAACTDIDENNAAPVSIEEDGAVVWKNTGPLDGCYDKLREIAGIATDGDA